MRLLLAAVLAVLSARAAADQVVIPAAKDNTLYDELTGALSNGAGDSFFAGMTGEPRVTRGLIEFDVDGNVPAGSTVTNVTMTLYMAQASVNDPFTPNTVGLYRALDEWGEGASHGPMGEGAGAAAAAGDATWIHTFYTGSLWASAGGDYVGAASASIVVPVSPGFNSWSSGQLAADVQLFLDQPADNHGWVVSGTETNNARRFESRTSSAGNFPMLTIDYDAPVVGVPGLGPAALLLVVALLAALGLQLREAR